MKLNTVILAAGKGTRMHSLDENKSKCSFEIFHKPLILYVLDAVNELKPDRNVVVVGRGAEELTKIVYGRALTVEQKHQLGTADALKAGMSKLDKEEGTTVVLNGDSPLIRGETLQKAYEFHKENHSKLTIITATLNEKNAYGRIKRLPNGQVEKIIETKDLKDDELNLNEINSGIYFIDNEVLYKEIDLIEPKNAQHEYYLTDIVGLAIKDGYKVCAYTIEDAKEIGGVNDRIDLMKAFEYLKVRINTNHLLNGVTIFDINNTYIGPDVKISSDVEIYPNTWILGQSTILPNNIIGPNSYLENVRIGESNHILSCHIVDTKIGYHNELGPYVRMRGGCIIEDHCRVGNFVELKNVHLHDGVKSAHLTYLGDSELGDNTNVGCGVITANYDGANKFHTIIGKNVFLGSNATLIAPIEVHDDAFVAAGSTITSEVLSNDLAIARARQVNKKGYAKVLRDKAKEKKNS